MNFKRKINLKNLENDKGVIDRLVDENLAGKLDNYLNKFDKKDVEGELGLSIEKNKKGLFNGALQVLVSGQKFRYEREDFKRLDDLVNHLFEHFKEELAKK